MVENKVEKGIDLLELTHKLWNNKKFIIKATVIGAIIGLIVAFSIPKEYTTTVVFTANSSDSKAGSIGSLASLAGINLGDIQSSEVFSPELYSDIMMSTPFVQSLLCINVKDTTQEINTTLYNYFKDNQKSTWWSYIIQIPGLLLNSLKSNDEELSNFNNNPYYISEEEGKVIKQIRESCGISYDKKSGLISLSFKAQSSVISAFVTDTIASYLHTYIIKARTLKAESDLVNTEKLYDQSKEDYYEKQQKLASFIDKNKNITSASYQINQSKLENEANLANTIYVQMAQQVQMCKLKVQDNTPVFTIIQPAIEPIVPSNLSKKIIVLVFLFFAFGTSCLWVLRKKLWETWLS